MAKELKGTVKEVSCLERSIFSLYANSARSSVPLFRLAAKVRLLNLVQQLDPSLICIEVDGRSPKEISDDIENGEIESKSKQKVSLLVALIIKCSPRRVNVGDDKMGSS